MGCVSGASLYTVSVMAWVITEQKMSQLLNVDVVGPLW